MADRITMSDVAREAGVSLMTVSRVVNNKDDVSPATRARVLDVIRCLNYRPSGIARGLATNRTGTLGLVIPDVANPFFSGLARGAEAVAYAQGYNVFLCNTDEDPTRELRVLASLDEKRVDGVLLCSSRLGEDDLREVVSRYTSVVLINRPLGDPHVAQVLIDDAKGGRMATDHLLQSGHRLVGFLAGPQASYSGGRRAAGYRASLEEAGLVYRPDWTRPCAPTVEGGREAAQDLLEACPELTALFCYNDLVAVGVLQACVGLGRRVPDELAVVGFDDIPLAALVTPALTTCRIPRRELGEQAVTLLLDQIGDSQAAGQELVLDPQLIVRASAPGPKPSEE